LSLPSRLVNVALAPTRPITKSLWDADIGVVAVRQHMTHVARIMFPVTADRLRRHDLAESISGAFDFHQSTTEREHHMAASIATERLAAGPETFQIMDVRRRPAFEASPTMIPGAVWGDPEALDSWSGDLDRRLPVIVYCVHGHQVSQGCANALEIAGFNAHYLEGGFEQWAVENRPLATK
jgi:thiosulfate sulfurtransferase